MEWNKYTITTTEEAEELVCAMLMEQGITSVEIEDKKPLTEKENGGLFGDVVPDLPPDDHIARISFYLEPSDTEDTTLRGVKNGLAELSSYADIGEGSITASKTAEEDWINNWKQYFHAFRIDDIAILPTWEGEDAVPDDVSMVLRIDPGTAFGTGAHESTQLAVRALRKYLKRGAQILDVGTGSGILGIVALKSGAAHVFGTDLDENVLPAVRDNLSENGISPDDFDVVLGNLIDDKATQDAAGYEKYDVVCANIIAEILASLTPEVPKHLKKGGVYITSGILTDREDVVRKAAEAAGLTEIETQRQGEWSSIVFIK